MKTTKIDLVTIVQFEEAYYWFIYEFDKYITNEKIYYKENPHAGEDDPIYYFWQLFFNETTQTIKHRSDVGTVLWERRT